MNFWSDTHSHIYGNQFDDDRDEVIHRAIELGVKRFYLPNIDSEHTDSLVELTNAYPENCFPMTGLHPCSVRQNYEEELSHVKWVYENQTKLFKGNSSIIAVGEIGIDLYWDKTFLKEQQLAFLKQCEWAKNWDLPIVIHVRDAFDEVFELLDQVNDSSLSGVFHCFTGNESQAQKVLEFGDFMIGLGGVATFKNSGLDKVIPSIPKDRVVLETDSPYLAPTPHRGKRNECSYIPLIAQKVADFYQISLEELSELTEENTRTLFKT